MGKRSVEVQVTVTRRLDDGEDPTEAANGLFRQVGALEGLAQDVILHRVTLKDGRRIVQRLQYRRPK